MHFLDFEQPIIELEAKIRDLSLLNDTNKEIFSLKRDVNSFLEKAYSKLSPWQIVQVARHPERPHASNYISALIKDFQTLSGDRSFAEDNAISLEESILDKLGEKSINWEYLGNNYNNEINRITYEEVVNDTRPIQTKKVLGVEVATGASV